MKSKIEHLLYNDLSRLPLLSLVPSRFEEESSLSLSERLQSLLPSFDIRLTRLRKRQGELSEHAGSQGGGAESELKGEVHLIRGEILMLETAISWLELQEEER